MKTTCNQCQKEIEISVRKFNFNKKKGFNIYCSKNCYSLNRRDKATIKTKCFNCNKPIKKFKREIKNSKTGNVYCSKSCAVSKNNVLFKRNTNHPNYTTGKSSYRIKILREIKNPKCNRCGFNKNIKALHIHHIDRNRDNNEKENLEILCANCHYIEH